jgi:hypothetical protein
MSAKTLCGLYGALTYADAWLTYADVGHLCQHTAWLIRCAAVMTKLVVLKY